jgi:DNA-binding SARP family transcriptional activator
VSPAPPRSAQLHLFGPPKLALADRVVQPGARKALAIVAYLALEGSQTRSKMAALFWPELDAAPAPTWCRATATTRWRSSRRWVAT